MKFFRLFSLNLPVLTVLTVSSCLGQKESIDFINAITASPTPTATSSGSIAAINTTNTLTLPEGVRAAKFIMRASNATIASSFDSLGIPANGVLGPTGYQASRVYAPDKDTTVISTSQSSATWPKWIPRFEVALSGSNNTRMTNASCARFAQSGESSAAQCAYANKNGSTTTSNCGATDGYYRTSEHDCMTGVTHAAGSGATNNVTPDPVFIRATFNRNYLDSRENIMVAIEYVASTLRSQPTTFAGCFASGFNPDNTNCSDMAWWSFLKRGLTDTSPSYANLFTPPSTHTVRLDSITDSLGLGETSTSVKQIYLPLASDSTFTVFQLSRWGARSDVGAATDFGKICDPGNLSNASGTATGANSTLCVGITFYSVTFYRM